MDSFESFIINDFYKMNFENIFHYKNFDLKKFLIWLKLEFNLNSSLKTGKIIDKDLIII